MLVNGSSAGQELPDTGRDGHRLDPGGNERLTAMTGTVLLVVFAVEVITTLLMGSMMGLHFFLGMLLIGPVFLKIGSTLWRFIRYYTGSEPYVRRGSPAPLVTCQQPTPVTHIESSPAFSSVWAQSARRASGSRWAGGRLARLVSASASISRTARTGCRSIRRRPATNSSSPTIAAAASGMRTQVMWKLNTPR